MRLAANGSLLWSQKAFWLTSVLAGGLWVGGMVAKGRFFELGILGLLALTGLALFRPVWGAMGVLGFAFVNPGIVPPLAEVGEFTFRMPDAVTIVLAMGIGLRLCLLGRLERWEEWWAVFRPFLGFLLYTGLSLGLVSIYVPSVLPVAVASYARLLTTVVFTWLLYMSARRSNDLSLLTRSVVLAALASVGIGIGQVWSGVEPGELVEGRYGGLLGLNTYGLASGLLVLYGFVGYGTGRPFLSWAFPVGAGCVGLFLSKSGSSMFATFGTLAIVWATTRRRSLRGVSALRLTGVGAAAMLLAVLSVWILRRADVLGLVTLTGGSWAQRLMIAYGGLRVFNDHPVLGVGWQASSSAAFIGDPGLNAVLMSTFADLPSHYFFLEQTTSLHNMYIQLLAELGVVGFGLLAYGVFQARKVVACILGEIPDQSPRKKWAVFCAFGLVYLLIWWNTNPLYGGQTESVLAFSFLAILAALWRLEKRRSAGRRSVQA